MVRLANPAPERPPVTRDEATEILDDLRKEYQRMKRAEKRMLDTGRSFRALLLAAYAKLPARALYRTLDVSRERVYQHLAAAEREQQNNHSGDET